MQIALYIGSNRLDLFKDDSIIIKNSVSKIEDISKVFTDTSNSFSVPATDKNNATFKHYYNASVNNYFDARKLVLGAIYIDGLHYKTGNFKLNKVIVKSQKATSYQLDFFGLLTELKELLKDDKLNTLDFSAYDFSYNYAFIENKLITNNPIRNVCATLLTNKRYIYDSNTATNNTDIAKNLAYNNSSVNSGIDWTDLSLSILNIRIIEAIESRYNITFSRDFFGLQAFSNLYLLLNGGNVNNLFKQQITFDDTFTNDPSLYNDTILLSTELAPVEPVYKLRIEIDLSEVNELEFTSIIKQNGIEIHKQAGQGRASDGLYLYDIYQTDFETFENLTFFIESESEIEFTYRVKRYYFNASVGAVYLFKLSEKDNSIIISDFVVSEKMPDIKIIDYLKGLFQTYKLIVIPTSESNLYVTTLNDYYRNGKVRDVTKYIDFTETPVNVGKLLNEINYKFTDSQTILAKQFFSNNGVEYGNLELSITDENGVLIDGEKLDYKLPFENMVYEKLSDLNNVNNPNVVYGLLANESIEPVTIKPHLHYINNVSLTNSVKIITSFNSTKALNSFNLPSHTLGYISPLFSTIFGSEFNEYNGNIINETLYSNYHKDYIQLLFNPKKREYNFKIKDAPTELIKNLKLNDAIVIKGKSYRINDYETNLITKEISFNLINSLSQSLTPIEYLTTDSQKVFASSGLKTNTLTIDKNYNELPD